MKNKYENLEAVMEQLQDEFLEEALEEKQVRRYRYFFWRYAGVAASICLVAGVTWWFFLNHNAYHNDKTKNFKVEVRKNPENKGDKLYGNIDDEGNTIYGGTDKEDVSESKKDIFSENIKDEISEIKYEKNIRNQKKLKKIECDFRVEGSGGGGNCGWLIVKSIEDVSSKNPTRNNVDGITKLPVFKNEKGLWKDFEKIGELGKEDVYFDHLCYEATRDYSYDGSLSNTWQLCFQADKSKNITDQLLEYSFYRIYGCVYGSLDDNITWNWSRMMTPPSDTGKMYPILSQKEAEQKLRKGEFFSCSANDADVAETAQILSVELEYMTEEYHTYIQPFYKFLITDESWDLSFMNWENFYCDNWKDYISVSEIYVPAIQDKYVEIKEDASLRVN